MNEAKWLTVAMPMAMLMHLRSGGQEPSDRRLRLLLPASLRALFQPQIRDAGEAFLEQWEHWADQRTDLSIQNFISGFWEVVRNIAGSGVETADELPFPVRNFVHSLFAAVD